jgi:hypothetical protein
MTTETFEYVVNFTIAHEGDTPFMYNNWPVKNPRQKDVTIGVGHALPNADEAVRPEILRMFTDPETGSAPGTERMRQEFEWVEKTPRTGGNLYSTFQNAPRDGKKPLVMNRAAMLLDLRSKLIEFWSQRGTVLPNLLGVPAQAQAALLSYNYGARLFSAPDMCAAVRAGDFVTASDQANVPIWDQQKNHAHRVLFLNAAAILASGGDVKKLPPANGPFKPPPSEPGAAALDAVYSMLPGKWAVTIGDWRGQFFFEESGDVSWAETDSSPKHKGQWKVNGRQVEWKFNDAGDIRTFTVPTPLAIGTVSGTILPAGQGWFTMTKSVGPPPGALPDTPAARKTGSLWLNGDGEVVHPDAPRGGGGRGFFRRAGCLFAEAFVLPHPKSAAARTLDPLVI